MVSHISGVSMVKGISVPSLIACSSALQRRVAAIGIAGIIRLAHAADQRGEPAPIAERGGVSEEHEIAPRHEGDGQARRQHDDLGIRGQRGVADGAEARDVEHMVRPEPRRPSGAASRDLRAHTLAAFELDAVALAVVEADGLDASV